MPLYVPVGVILQQPVTALGPARGLRASAAKIGAVLSALALARRMGFPLISERHALSVLTYAIGILAAVWFIERLAGFAK